MLALRQLGLEPFSCEVFAFPLWPVSQDSGFYSLMVTSWKARRQYCTAFEWFTSAISISVKEAFVLAHFSNALWALRSEVHVITLSRLCVKVHV